ncbi:MAG: hypothetical protein ACRC6G_12905, partial [Deefgea sp.]
MPMKKERYPANWKQISIDVRARAGNVCETCGVRNQAYIYRHAKDAEIFIYYIATTDGFTLTDGTHIRQSEIPNGFNVGKQPTRVILTVHHIGVQ